MVGLLSLSWAGCSATEKGIIPEFIVPQKEADWIIEGQPIMFEGESLYPQDNVDILLDSEVLLVGEYKNVQLFVEKIDVKPYDRIYTKFGRNKFRIFTKKIPDDKSQ